VPITSTSNPVVKRARSLRQRKYREREGAFLVEGIHPLWQALDHGAPVETILVAPELLTSDAATKLIDRFKQGGGAVAELSARAFESISGRDNPSGLAAVIEVEGRDLDEASVEQDSLFVAVHQVANPGNLGTIIRTADAVRSDGVVVTGRATDPFHPAAVKASTGTLFSTPVYRVDDFDRLNEWRRRQGLTLVVTSAHAETEHWKVDYPRPCVVAFGSEAEGLPAEIMEEGDIAVRIPMHGGATSLNLAVAAGVVLYEAARPP
jgi:RNA methyltransferase, TrmH family